MTLMKAEYTGRVKRREDKITELEAKIASLTGTAPAASFAESCADKENDVSMSQASANHMSHNLSPNKHKNNSPNKSLVQSKQPAPKPAKTVKLVEEDEQGRVAGKRSTRSSGKALAPV